MKANSGTVILLFIAFGVATAAQTAYFPPGSLDPDSKNEEFLSEWYSAQLKALDEPSLWELSKSQKGQSFRFLWLRTFDHPIAIRIDIKDDGSSRVTAKMASGAGGYKPGKLVKNMTSELTRDQTEVFLSKIKQDGFWELPTHRESGGSDGAEWILEGVRDGTYRIVVRWTPKNGPVRDIGLFMLKDLAKLNVPANEIY